jgi:hypothetical protein
MSTASVALPGSVRETGGVLSNGQTWTLIGTVISLLVAMVGLTLRTLRSEIRGVDERLGTRIDALHHVMDARFNAVDARFNAVDQRFNAVDQRFDRLDRDVQALTNHVFRDR